MTLPTEHVQQSDHEHASPPLSPQSDTVISISAPGTPSTDVTHRRHLSDWKFPFCLRDKKIFLSEGQIHFPFWRTNILSFLKDKCISFLGGQTCFPFGGTNMFPFLRDKHVSLSGGCTCFPFRHTNTFSFLDEQTYFEGIIQLKLPFTWQLRDQQ